MYTDQDMLVKKACKGDINAFEELTAQYYKNVYNIALKMLSNPDIAYDAAQETFLRIFKSISKFKMEAKFSTWIYRITSNVCIDIIRKNRKNEYNTISIDKKIHLSEGDITLELKDDSLEPDELYEKSQKEKMLMELINELPEEQKQIIVLRDIQDMSYFEISNILKLPEGTVKSRLNRTRLKLRSRITSDKELSDLFSVKFNNNRSEEV